MTRMRSQPTRLIDDRGEFWDANSWDLRRTFHLVGVTGDVSRTLIGNLGFIGLRHIPGTHIVTFCPRTVSGAAIGALLYRLLQEQDARTYLRILRAGPSQCDQLFGSVRAAVTRMHALVDEERTRRSVLPFARQPDRLETMPQQSVFAAVFNAWRASRGLLLDTEVLHRLGASRYVMIEPRSDAGALAIVDIGRGLQIPDKTSRAGLIGSPLDDIPDYQYGQWVAREYRQVLTAQSPHYDHIAAAIFWPRAGRVVRRYSRLILPCQHKSGRPFLLGVSGELVGPELDIDAA